MATLLTDVGDGDFGGRSGAAIIFSRIADGELRTSFSMPPLRYPSPQAAAPRSGAEDDRGRDGPAAGADSGE